MAEDRHSFVPQAILITDPDALARREAENGVAQFYVALDLIKTHVHDAERPFRLRTSHILQLQYEALRDIHPMAGAFRNTPVSISGSTHQPPAAFMVPEEVADLCAYIADHWTDRSAIHLSAYVLWRLNWIHPFADGNGRTARTVSYVVLSIKLNSVLPGAPTIPDQISTDKKPYYDALEMADAAYVKNATIDVSALEAMIEGMLATQLLSATSSAALP